MGRWDGGTVHWNVSFSFFKKLLIQQTAFKKKLTLYDQILTIVIKLSQLINGLNLRHAQVY